jgi:PAS domain S-box-containing protein
VAAIQGTMQTGVSYELELQAFRTGTPIWIIARGAVVRNSTDQIVGLRGTVQEITGRKQAELALAERNLQLALAGKAGLVGSYAYDIETGMMQISEGYAALHGLPEGTDQHTFDQWRKGVHPDDLALFDQRREQLFASRCNDYTFDYRLIRADGGVRWLESRGVISYDRDGRPRQVIGINIDVTERKRAELALAERNAQLDLAAKTAGIGCYTNNLKTGLIGVSEGYAAIHGLPEGTVQTTLTDWRPRVHPGDLASFDWIRDQIFANRQRDYTFDYRIIRADGGARWIESRGCVSYDEDGQPEQCIGINIDVTERKQNEARLSDALAAGRVVAFEWDAVTRRSQRSNNAQQILGIVQGGGFLRQIHPADRRNLNALVRNLSPGNPSYALTFRFARSDSSTVWLEEEAKGEFDASGRLLRIKGLTRDITERKELEDHKSVLIAELDHRVKNVLATVSAIASHTKETSKSRAEFITALDGRIRSMAITHELLSARHWQGIPLAELLHRELAPYAIASNTRVDGPDVVLRAEAGLTLAMVFHELATNSAKFGAISAKSGRVSVRWSFKHNGGAERWLSLRWEESGGPHVAQPTRLGHGTAVIRDLVPYELGGTSELAHLPEGVRCNLRIPAQWLSACTG